MRVARNLIESKGHGGRRGILAGKQGRSHRVFDVCSVLTLVDEIINETSRGRGWFSGSSKCFIRKRSLILIDEPDGLRGQPFVIECDADSSASLSVFATPGSY